MSKSCWTILSFRLSRMRLLHTPGKHDASLESLQLLEAMPDREYKSMEDINTGLDLIGETATEENLY